MFEETELWLFCAKKTSPKNVHPRFTPRNHLNLQISTTVAGAWSFECYAVNIGLNLRNQHSLKGCEKPAGKSNSDKFWTSTRNNRWQGGKFIRPNICSLLKIAFSVPRQKQNFRVLSGNDKKQLNKQNLHRRVTLWGVFEAYVRDVESLAYSSLNIHKRASVYHFTSSLLVSTKFSSQ